MKNKQRWIELYSKYEWNDSIKKISKLAQVDTDFFKFKDILKEKNKISEEKIKEILDDIFKIESYEALKLLFEEKLESKFYDKFSLQVI